MEEIKAIEAKKCPQCGAIASEHDVHCSTCGCKLRDRTEADLTDEEKARLDEEYYGGIRKKLAVSMKAITITQTVLYYGIYVILFLIMFIAMGKFGGPINLDIIQIFSSPVFIGLSVG